MIDWLVVLKLVNSRMIQDSDLRRILKELVRPKKDQMNSSNKPK